MSVTTREVAEIDQSPIDLVQDLAEERHWDVDRLADDQIAMAVSGAWRTYSVSLAWCEVDETLRLICTFDLEPARETVTELYRAIEVANDRFWLGGFNLWSEHGLMAYRYGLSLRGGAAATSEQADAMLKAAIENCERFIPVFEMVCEGAAVEKAMDAALLEAAGRA